MKKITVLKIILLIMILIVTFLIIRSTYSKYITSADDNTSLDIANWNIKLNNEDIKNNKNFSKNMNLKFDPNPYIDSNTIAPTSTGSFKINLESTGTDVPYLYSLNLDGNSNFKIEFSDYIINKKELTTKMSFSLYIDFSYYKDLDSLKDLVVKLNIPTEKLTKFTISNSTNASIIATDTISFNVINIYDPHYTFDFDLEYEKILDLSSKQIISNITLNDMPFIYSNNSLADFEIYRYYLNENTNPVNLSLPYIVEVVSPGDALDTPVIRNYTFNFRWNDTDTNKLDNFNDVELSKVSKKLSIPLKLNIFQIIESQ